MRKRRKLSKTERQTVYEKCNGHCAYCGESLEIKNMQVDHMEAWECGGEDTMENFLPACRSCNHYKHTLSIEEFRKYLEKIPQKLVRDSVAYKNGVRYGLVVPNPKPVVFYFETLEIQEG